MKHLHKAFLFTILVTLLTAPQQAVAQVDVRESSAHIDFLPSQLRLRFPVNVSPGAAQHVSVLLKVLDTQGEVQASSNVEAFLKVGEQEVMAAVDQPFAKVRASELDDLRWFRISYEIRGAGGAILASGIIPIANEKSDFFRLAVASARLAPEGRRYRVRVNAADPNTLKPLRAVELTGELSWEDDNGANKKVNARGVTDANGDGALDFPLPLHMPKTSGELKVTGHKGILVRGVTQDVSFSPESKLLLDTDKDIYQPGQTLHIRALIFDADRHAAVGTKLDMKIKDEDDSIVLHETLVADSFGVAHSDWPIPSNLKLGNYDIEVGEGEVEDSNAAKATERVHIYRYDLPNFSVEAQPDRRYYIAGQDAEIAVSAEYLFGKPVTRGQVRVVEEKERTWDFHKQQWDIKEGQVVSGDLDQVGRFKAKLNLSDFHDFQESDYERFVDVNMAAYVTDLTTGRTEQRRVTVRVSQQPIHVYINQTASLAEGLPANFFVSAFYADGTPARCNVRVSAVEYSYSDAHPKNPQFLRNVKTNKYGLAKLSNLSLNQDGDKDGNALLAEAADIKGLHGSHVERFSYYDPNSIYVSTSHTIFKAGEPIDVFLQTTKPDVRVVVDVLHDDEVLASQTVTIRNRKANLFFPADKRFSDDITIFAYALDATSDDQVPMGIRGVIFPKNRRLDTQIAFDKTSYRPGEQATAHLTVHMPDGENAESSLGIKMIDRAVEDRSLTDSDFNGTHSHWWRWSLWSTDASFAGVSRDDLDLIDLSQPVPEDVDLVAEYMLSSASYPSVRIGTNQDERNPASAFSQFFNLQFQKLEQAIRDGNNPYTLDQLIALGKNISVDVLDLKDPWGTAYRYSLEFKNTVATLKIRSAGPDKQFGTKDDFDAQEFSWQYFLHEGQLIDRAENELLRQQSKFIRDHDAMRKEMLPLQVDIDTLRDPWGNPYDFRFTVEGSQLVIYVMSNGPGWDGRAPVNSNGAFMVWRSALDYFTQPRTQILQAVSAYVQKNSRFPQSQDELEKILAASGIDLDSLRDPWGQGYYVSFRSAGDYGDHALIKLQAQQQTGKPVTLVRRELNLISPGPDGQPNTSDDFTVVSYSALMQEEVTVQKQPSKTPEVSPYAPTAFITGTVLDVTGAVVAGARVSARDVDRGTVFVASTDTEGRFLLSNLLPGIYTVDAARPGFVVTRIANVSVGPSIILEMNITLQVGNTSAAVEVTASAPTLETSTAELSAVASRSSESTKAVGSKAGIMMTPRLRQYFPETLLWEPALLTDRKGHAQLNFKLADNITTWKVSATASTKTGELGRAEVDLRAFQPFFVEHDPPTVLTEGDVIDYPVVLRNYLDKRQTVTVSMKPESWFSLLGPAEQRITIDSGDAANAVFRYRTIASVNEGKQRVSAANSETSDAAEKTLQVHPFGRPESATDSQLLRQSGVLKIQVPTNAVPNSLVGELKVYPNFMAHVMESIEALLEQPHGCGEQTISSTYPSLLVAEFYQKSTSVPPIALKARRYLHAGYDRLLGYQDSTGGFTYWGHGDPDLALTAYALDFLGRTSQVINVDPKVIADAQNWLAEQQKPDGSWRVSESKDNNQVLMETAYIARTLAEVSRNGRPQAGAPHDAITASLNKAFQFLDIHHELLLEPYTIANAALAALASLDRSSAAVLIEKLRRNAHYEDGAAYWVLDTNTPLYSWGLPGRLESTALVVRALAGFHGANSKSDAADNPNDDALINQGLLYLLHNKGDGIWYSGQTTMNVLEALLGVLSQQEKVGNRILHVLVNEQELPALTISSEDALAGPLLVDLKAYLKPGENRVKLEGAGPSSLISAQLLANYYVPWEDGVSIAQSAKKKGSSNLKLSVTYSKTRASIGEPIECRVKAGHSGYGMMLGEIGLPPGAEVDRESLELAAKNGWSLDHYDVLPDRVIVYLWPSSEVTEFTFKFHLRFPIDAETAPSKLYDYYNPDASVILKPVHFERNTAN